MTRYNAGLYSNQEELSHVHYYSEKRYRGRVPPRIPREQGRYTGMMLPARIRVMHDSGWQFRMYACRKITGPAP